MAECHYSADSARDPHPLSPTCGAHRAAATPALRADVARPEPWAPTANEALPDARTITTVIANRS